MAETIIRRRADRGTSRRRRSPDPAAPAQPSEQGASPALRWLIVTAAMIGAVLEVLDTSITNVAVPQMMGNLGATLSEIGWVSTGYIISNVIVLPMTGWLSDRFGRRQYFAASIVVFTLASLMCGLSTSLPAPDLLARRPGTGRRRAAGDRPGHHAASLPQGPAGHGDGHLRHGRHGRPLARPGARRLADRQLLLALDIFHQPALRHRRRRPDLAVRPGWARAGKTRAWTSSASACWPPGWGPCRRCWSGARRTTGFSRRHRHPEPRRRAVV